MSIKFTVQVNNKFGVWSKTTQQQLRQLPKDAYNFFVKTTPIDTGNARKSTKLAGSTIEANYPYAGVLDKGRHMTSNGMRGSNQAPKGMSKPTEQYIQRRVRQIIGK